MYRKNYLRYLNNHVKIYVHGWVDFTDNQRTEKFLIYSHCALMNYREKDYDS